MTRVIDLWSSGGAWNFVQHLLLVGILFLDASWAMVLTAVVTVTIFGLRRIPIEKKITASACHHKMHRS